MRTVNIDISDLYRGRGRTGIQRVVRELTSRLLRADSDDYELRILRFDYEAHRYLVIDRASTLEFLVGSGDELEVVGQLDFDDFTSDDVFYDIDSAWNSPLKRPFLYERLTRQGVLIVTTVYDLAPLTHPQLANPNTLRNWTLYLAAVYAYTHIVITGSQSTERELLHFAREFGVTRHIPTVVIGNGADYTRPPAPSAEELALVQPFIDGEYILFVGTIEPRKRQRVAIDAMEAIHAVRPDAHLVFAGKEGWNSSETMRALREHPYYGRRIHWVNTPSDALLSELYSRASLCLYLSHAEGYGLPVAEALSHNTVTIASNNTSVYEVGEGFTDYVHFTTPSEVAETVLTYLESEPLRRMREAQIERGYQLPTWDLTFSSVDAVLRGLDAAAAIAARPVPSAIPWVFISNVPESLRRTIALLDVHVPWISEYVIIAPASLRSEMSALSVARPVRFLAEEDVLGERMPEFEASDHVGKNWMLRSSLVQIDELAEEFVMGDDDNQPLVDIPLDTFISGERRYSGYYFYEMPRWPHRQTSYDYGIAEGRKRLRSFGLETLAYSSHQPQVVNKSLFAEAIALQETGDPLYRVDEWNAYFNFVASRYPTLLAKRVFRTLNWPSHPRAWHHAIAPGPYLFNNYYPASSKAAEPGNVAVRLSRKAQEERPYIRSAQLYSESVSYINDFDLAHGTIQFRAHGVQLLVSGLPQVITVAEGAPVRLPVAFVHFSEGRRSTDLTEDSQLCYRILGQELSYGMRVENRELQRHSSENGLIELSVPSRDLPRGVYDIEFFAKLEGEYVFVPGVRYLSKLVVCGSGDALPEVYRQL